jgi:peptidoglycan/xylan/chitin deacetylase (PgdA/CDA1 family)
MARRHPGALMPPRAVLKVLRVVVPALAAFAAAIWAASRLPAPWNAIGAAAVAAVFLGATALALDAFVPGVNLFSGALRRLPPSAGPGAVALTFDDGPVEPFTRQILDALDAAGAKATFFCVGENIDRFPELAREIVRRGHTLGNHTRGHRILTRLPEAEIAAEIEGGALAAERATGVRPRLLRCPKGYKGLRVARVARRLGLPLVGFGYPIYDVQNPPDRKSVV